MKGLWAMTHKTKGWGGLSLMLGRTSPLETDALETLGVKACIGEGKTTSKTII